MFNRDFCWSVSIPTYNVLHVAALMNVIDDFGDHAFVCISRMCLVCQFNRSRFVCAYVGSLPRLVTFLLTTTIRLGLWRMG